MEWSCRPLKPLPSNKYEEDEDEKEDVGATLASIEDGSPTDEDYEGSEDDREENRKDTALYDARDNKEEASLGNKGESALLYSSEKSDNEDEDDDRTGADDNSCDGDGADDGDGGGDRNTSAGG